MAKWPVYPTNNALGFKYLLIYKLWKTEFYPSNTNGVFHCLLYFHNVKYQKLCLQCDNNKTLWCQVKFSDSDSDFKESCSKPKENVINKYMNVFYIEYEICFTLETGYFTPDRIKK